jgi:sn-glycerol 3-phosphate transport system substrate-binding protein
MSRPLLTPSRRLATPSRRTLLAGLGLGAAGLGVSACGAPGGSDDAGSPVRDGFAQADLEVPAKYRDRTPILFWAPFTGSLYSEVQSLLKKFNDSQDEIVAISESQGSYADLNQKFTASLQAKAVPDIVCFPEMQWLQFYFSSALAPLDDYFDDDWNLDVYLPNYVDEGKAAGSTYAVPFARSNPLFYYNKTRYKELGLPEEGPKTWDELAQFAPEITKVEVDGKPLAALAFSSADEWFGQADIWAFGGRNSEDFEVTINQDPGVEWLEWQRKFIHEDRFGYMAKSPGTDFTTGIAAATRGSTASLRGFTEEADFEVGAAFMLGQVNAPTKVPTGGSGLSIVRSDSKDRQDACAELFRFLAEPENSAQWHKGTGYVPIVKAAKDTKIVKDLVEEDPNFQVALDQLENAQTADRTNWFQGAVTDIAASMAQVYGDNAEPKKVLDALAPKLEEVLEDNRDDLEKVLG